MFWSPRSRGRQPDGSSSVRGNRASVPAATTAPRDFALSPEAWKDLVRVNKWVNETIKPLTDLEHWGVVERWSYPDDGYGDCEDYVLLKRRMLIQSGWPREALLVTVVRDKKDEGHAVLTVTTDKGDYVLDNQNEDILLWSETGYRFVKRQSQSDPNVWVSLGNPRPVDRHGNLTMKWVRRSDSIFYAGRIKTDSQIQVGPRRQAVIGNVRAPD